MYYRDMEKPEHLQHCTTETVPGKSFVSSPQYPDQPMFPNEPKPRCPCGCEDGANEKKLDQELIERRSAQPNRPLTYLACPYTYKSEDKAQADSIRRWRAEQATKAACWLINGKGWNVMSPITHSHPMHETGACEGDWNFWKKIDREYLSCSCRLVVIMIEGWRESVGVQAETKIAEEMGIPVVYLYVLAEGTHYGLTTIPDDWDDHNTPDRVKHPDIRDATPILNGPSGTKLIRTFETGATRDTDQDKPDYEGFLSPLVLEEFGRYMLVHQKQADGNLRSSDNWQKGIPKEAYIKSMFRHFFDTWKLHRGLTVTDKKTGKPVTMNEALCALMFNVMGYLYEITKP